VGSGETESAGQPGSHKVFVGEDGLYQLTRADLASAGLPVGSLDPRKLQLFEGDREVAVRVTGEGDGSLDPGDVLLFYGRVPRSRYADQNVYWLRSGVSKGLRMARRQVQPAQGAGSTVWTRQRWEENRLYDPLYASVDGDHWYGADMRPGSREDVPLKTMEPSSGAAARLQVRVVGYTRSPSVNPDHHLALSLNGSSIGHLRWDGQGAVAPTMSLNASLLAAGQNTLTIETPGDTGATVEGAWLDAVELEYALEAAEGAEATFWVQVGRRDYRLGGFGQAELELYDVTDPQRPIELSGFGVTGGSEYTLSFRDTPGGVVAYYASTRSQVRSPVDIVADRPSDLRNKSNGADYVLIAPREYLGALGPLLVQRQLQGLQVKAVDVQDIYDEYGRGLPDPEAIRSFVAYALRNWSLAPTYVVLAGDGHWDYLDHFGYGRPNPIPPYLGMVDPWWGETAADNRYAAVIGNDILPDVLIGRLPVNSAAEAEVLAAKIVQYEREPQGGKWNARHVFVADGRDHAGDYASALDESYNAFVHPPLVGRKVYRDRLSMSAARRATLEAWQEGALMMSYMGHSSWHQWSADSMLSIQDVPQLRNGHKQPILLSMTCFSGFFHHPEYATLDESLVVHGNGGAVASWSPSGLGLLSGHRWLHKGFYRSVFDDGEKRLGPASLAAKLELYAHADAYDELLDTYHLFGDPAMVVNTTLRPWPHKLYLPIQNRNSRGG
jgi:hypothetical protein